MHGTMQRTGLDHWSKVSADVIRWYSGTELDFDPFLKKYLLFKVKLVNGCTLQLSAGANADKALTAAGTFVSLKLRDSAHACWQQSC